MAAPRSGVLSALRDLGGAMLPLSLRDLDRELGERVRKIPTELNEFGYDRFGLHPETALLELLPAALLYRYYFRAEVRGVERVPRSRVLLVANHAGQLPFDGAMLGVAMLLEAEPPRIARALGEYWIPRLPWVSVAASRAGHLVGTPENGQALLEAEECVMVFPEGVRGINKPWSQRYRLQRFGLGFLRLALAARAPIVPVGIVGSEEQQPGLANLERVGRVLGMPSFPVTLGFPWLGPLGILPLPVKYRIHFGEPIHFEGSPSDEDSAIEEKVEHVKESIDGLLAEGRRERAGVFH